MALKVFAITVKPGISFIESEGLNALATVTDDGSAAIVTAEAALDDLVDAALLVPAIDADPASEAAVEAIRTEYATQFATIDGLFGDAAASLATGNVIVQIDTTVITTKNQLRAAMAAFYDHASDQFA